jgi:hypothetical protein
MSVEVFAYGSNMCSGRFRDYKVRPEGRGQPALLLNYRLRFNKPSTNDGSGKANVEPRTGGEVWGVLYTIPDDDLPNLDRGEGGYFREKMSVLLNGVVAPDVWVYVARRPLQDPLLRPYTWYTRFLVEGAIEHDLPAEYIEGLRRIEANQDEDQERDRAKRLLLCRSE